mmetsp:Transcript_19242/g.27064  ORF Transcript_19242/g.27064 Transcript_19242/m.27064 type:complete len:240 (+) Transcript_19242:67-786(+)
MDTFRYSLILSFLVLGAEAFLSAESYDVPRCFINESPNKSYWNHRTLQQVPSLHGTRPIVYTNSRILALETQNSNAPAIEETRDDDDDSEDEWEYEEFENLTETDFYGSEWKVGTLMDNSNKIQETWCRLVVKDGQNIAIWGDSADGKWNFDVASQFLSISKESFGGWFGKQIWAGSVDDYYYIQGTVRGWSPISPASVLGQWQSSRLGVSKDEAGIAPWFEDDGDGDDDDDEKMTTST